MAEAGYPRLSAADKARFLPGYQALIQRLTRSSEAPRGFPGSMPVTLSRRHLRMLHDADYLVLEKSDGVRYLLYATEQAVLLLDRRLDAYAVVPYPVLIMPDGSLHAGTLLDGELVRNQRTGQYEYLVYDVLAVQGDVEIARQDYRVRLDAIERYATFPRSLHPATAGCLRIRRKDVYEKGELSLLFSRIQQRHVVAANDDDDDDGGGGIGEYRYEHLRADGVLSNGNDGLVFTPVKLPYTLRTCAALLKYKYPTHHTVDFTLWLEGDSGGHDVHTFLGYRSENGITRYREVYFPTRRKRAWFADYSQWHECIIECTYDRQAGEWRYLRRRTDKESPNYASVVMDCLEAIAESITCEELLQRVTDRSPAPCARADKTAPGSDLFDAANADYTRSTPMSPYPPPVQSAAPP